jgi:threonine dehydrogenase-like Zn-dependent dehydrogenase
VVVTGQQQHTAMGRDASRVAMLEDVTGTVHARSLAVPHGEHAVVFGTGKQVGLLTAPHRRRRQFLVEARLEVDVRSALR